MPKKPTEDVTILIPLPEEALEQTVQMVKYGLKNHPSMQDRWRDFWEEWVRQHEEVIHRREHGDEENPFKLAADLTERNDN